MVKKQMTQIPTMRHLILVLVKTFFEFRRNDKDMVLSCLTHATVQKFGLSTGLKTLNTSALKRLSESKELYFK